MNPRHQYCVYIMTNRSGTLYVGVTSNLPRRVLHHKQGFVEGFTKQYQIDRLVYYEVTGDVHGAREREKQIKGWLRKKKIALIAGMNAKWKDLSEEWYEGEKEGTATAPAVNTYGVLGPSLRSGSQGEHSSMSVESQTKGRTN